MQYYMWLSKGYRPNEVNVRLVNAERIFEDEEAISDCKAMELDNFIDTAVSQLFKRLEISTPYGTGVTLDVGRITYPVDKTDILLDRLDIRKVFA